MDIVYEIIIDYKIVMIFLVKVNFDDYFFMLNLY